MKKELPITPPEGYEIDKERMVFVPKEIELFPEEEQMFGYIEEPKEPGVDLHFKDKIFGDKIFAFAKLVKIRDEVNRRDGFVADWKNPLQQKWCIEYYDEKQQFNNHTLWKQTFAFRTKEITQQFAEKYKHLIDECPDLI